MLEDLGVALAGVRLSFSTDAAQQFHWRVSRFDAWERSASDPTPYQVTIDLVCEDPEADPFTLDGSSCTLTLKRGPQVVRRFHGIVVSTSLVGWRSRGNAVIAKIEVVPAFACLHQGRTSRRFQDQSVPEILTGLLTGALARYGREVKLRLTDDKGNTSASMDRYLPRDLCVQRDESDLSFARRLMEEEGIAFFFEDAGDRERLVLVDANATYPAIDERLPVRLLPTTGSVPHFESVEDFSLATRAVPGTVSVKTFDATRPNADLRATAHSLPSDSPDRKGLPPNAGRESVYQFGAGIVSSGYRNGEYATIDTDWKAKIRLEEAQAGMLIGQGCGNVTSFAMGRSFRLASDQRLLDREYLIVAVSHHGEQSADDEGSGGGYSNSFDCIPATTPLRLPRQTRRHRAVFDVAVVVGPPGIDDDIYVDEHGRIRINFLWNREDLEEGEPDPSRSCWVPVAQGWLGNAFGMQVIPRRGMRVLVGYPDGDLDRPIVLHCIETGANRLPYDPSMEGQKTRTVFFRTQTSPPGKDPRNNELSTQDAADKEEILLHAGRDLRVCVDQDQRVDVTRNEHRAVGGTRWQKVHDDETLINEGARETTIDHDDRLTIKGGQIITVTGVRDATIKDKEKLTAKNREAKISGDDSLHVVERREVTIDGAMVFHQGNTIVECSAGNADANVAGWLRVRRGGAQISVDEAGNVLVGTDRELRLEAPGASVVLAEGKIRIAAETGVEVSAATSGIKLDAGGVTTTGVKISDEAQMLHQTTAPIIAQN